MSQSSNSIVRYVNVQLRPALLRRFDMPTLLEVTIDVETQYDTYSISEVIPEDDFTRRFDWYIDRAKREILNQVKKLSGE